MTEWIVKYDGPCSKCGTMLRAGERAVWIRGANRMECIECPTAPIVDPSPPPMETGLAGGSARREEEQRLAKREATNKERWGERVGGWVTRFGAVPQSTRAWGLGAHGEELLAQALATVPGILTLHDRRVPGSRGNLDHLVVAPAGVFVVDAKYIEGLIEVRDYGGFFRTDLRLTVGRRDRSKLARSMGWQIEAVTGALIEAGVDPLPTITPILCFVDGEWPLFRRPRVFEGVRLESERSIAAVFASDNGPEPEVIEQVARILAGAFPPK